MLLEQHQIHIVRSAATRSAATMIIDQERRLRPCCTSLLYMRQGHDPKVRIMPLTWVGVAGFEPTTSSSRTKRATKLRHTPRPLRSLPDPPTDPGSGHRSAATGQRSRTPVRSRPRAMQTSDLADVRSIPALRPRR